MRYSFKKVISIIFIILVVSALCFFAYKIHTTEINYIAFGDSLAQGYPYFQQNIKSSYTDLIYADLDKMDGIFKNRVNYHNYGVSGYTSTDLLSQISKQEVEQKIVNADIITINIGGNDILQTLWWHKPDEYEYLLASADKYIDNLANIFSKIRTVNSHALIYISGIFNPAVPGDDRLNYKDSDYMVKYLNKLIKNTAAPYNVKFIDISNVFNGHEYKTKDTWFYDMLHPNKTGYAAMSKPFIKVIRSDFSTEFYYKSVLRKLF